ncbi:alpha/beta fold hydrolase [Pseudoprimorskyibacter insulae]|uniref:2-succinyl-6-hydroxy-2, 4-cyclohexadiene-1-carboxylate synthase n=1 Tax=Pseudoprimorskyibacter insulae TaxID=1695997 RepID=A0A2R8B006_9RHOB|nr:alpha/beta hydrolase [Pseudoprimorskyibacter insulae]SPF81611.1 2-succinyl-6-hydroxy-2, 4-cyclohexadiene-1-carboxylate synthase [Pseudoprimorskyibacter insulae]
MAIDWSAGRGRFTANGKSLEWGAFGPAPGDAPVIVLLHEGLGSLALWRDFPQRLSDATGLPVFAYSRAGYGQSDADDLPRPLDYMTREATQVLPDVLNALGASHVILMGHSDGATIAAEYAGRVEDFRVRGLVLMAPHFFTEEMGLTEIARAAQVFAETDMGARLGKYHRDPEATFRGWNDAWLAPGFKDWHVGDVIDYWRIPCLAIQGVQDQYGTAAHIHEIETRSYAPVDVLMLDDCRHSPHFDQPQAVLDGVAEFAARLQRIEAAEVEGV